MLESNVELFLSLKPGLKTDLMLGGDKSGGDVTWITVGGRHIPIPAGNSDNLTKRASAVEDKESSKGYATQKGAMAGQERINNAHEKAMLAHVRDGREAAKRGDKSEAKRHFDLADEHAGSLSEGKMDHKQYIKKYIKGGKN